ncbi:hypothetical protein [Bacillus sp. FJAT-27445]|uniref:hypothetical protein n=1 Tax=Bacillus sp. FJAT-27445 TaxID=1679166 RepID=UPI0012E37800|nr:hypothetical protein [Bacillus sp. FJAT-27445]
MELAKLRYLAEELKEVPYVQSEVTHVFTLDNKELVTLRYSKERALFHVTNIDGKIAFDYERADQAAEAVKKALESYSDKSPLKDGIKENAL